MSLTRLLIRDFRNIETADLALSPGFNFLVGANGSGKTSVLEAIYTLDTVLPHSFGPALHNHLAVGRRSRGRWSR